MGARGRDKRPSARGAVKNFANKRRARSLRSPQAERSLSEVNESGLWKALLNTKDLRLRFNALKYLTDRRDGRPPQAASPAGDRALTVKLVLCSWSDYLAQTEHTEQNERTDS